MAGGVWYLRDWERLDRQSRARPDRLPVRHAAAADPGKPDPRRVEAQLTDARGGRRLLHRFSPTGFYSSAVRNPFLRELEARSERQIAFSIEAVGDHHLPARRRRERQEFLGDAARPASARANGSAQGFTDALQDARQHARLRHAARRRSRSARIRPIAWAASGHAPSRPGRTTRPDSTGRLADPRSFCIQKTLQDIAMAAMSSRT